MKEIRRVTRRQFSAEEKIRIVLTGLRGEDSIAELCRREGKRICIFWKYFRNAFARDAGFRIDQLLLSPPLAEHLISASVDRDVRRPRAGAMLLEFARLCRRCRPARLPRWRKTSVFPRTEEKSSRSPEFGLTSKCGKLLLDMSSRTRCPRQKKLATGNSSIVIA